MAYFVQIVDQSESRRYRLAPGVTRIGAADDCGLQLARFGVADRHAEIESVEGRLQVRDLGTPNGIVLNGDRVAEAELAIGDRLLIGSVLLILRETRIDIDPATPRSTRAAERPLLPFPVGFPVGGDPGPPAESPRPEIQALREILAFVRPDADPRSACERALEVLAELYDAPGAVMHAAKSGEQLEPQAVVGDGPGAPPQLLDDAFHSGAIRNEAVNGRMYAAVPLKWGGRVYGVFELSLPTEAWPQLERNLHESAALISAAAVGLCHLEVRDATLRATRGRMLGVEGAVVGTATTDEEPTALTGAATPLLRLRAELERHAADQGPLWIEGERGAGHAEAARTLHALADRNGGFLALHAADLAAPPYAELLDRSADGDLTKLTANGTVFLSQAELLSPPAIDRIAARIDDEDDDRRWIFGTESGEALAAPLAERAGDARVVMPALRERGSDVLELARRFAVAAPNGNAVSGLSADACRQLVDHDWPGNVEELQAEIQRAVSRIGPDGVIDSEHLSLPHPSGAHDEDASLAWMVRLPWKEARLVFERLYFTRLYRDSGGNVSESSRVAGIARKNVYQKLRHHGLAGLSTSSRPSRDDTN